MHIREELFSAMTMAQCVAAFRGDAQERGVVIQDGRTVYFSGHFAETEADVLRILAVAGLEPVSVSHIEKNGYVAYLVEL